MIVASAASSSISTLKKRSSSSKVEVEGDLTKSDVAKRATPTSHNGLHDTACTYAEVSDASYAYDTDVSIPTGMIFAPIDITLEVASFLSSIFYRG